MCQKWLILSKDKMIEYDVKPYICICGYYKIPFLLHVENYENGDYECYLCSKDVIYIPICTRCKTH
jgi:hypothetical protein